MSKLPDDIEIALEEAFAYIVNESVRAAFAAIIDSARAGAVPIRSGNHGYMNRVFTLAPAGTRHPAVVVYRHKLTLYVGPVRKIEIQSTADIPRSLLGL